MSHVRRRYTCAYALAVLALAATLSAQTNVPITPFSPTTELNANLPGWLKFDAEFRTRFEGYSGGGFKPSVTDAYALTRLRLGMTIAPVSWLKLYVEGMDARAIAKSPALPPYQNSWDLRQAYVQFGKGESAPVGLRAGRQALDFGDQRLVGEALWNNTSRTFDAIRGTFQEGRYRVDLFAASVVNQVDGTWDHHQDGNNLHGIYGGIEKLVPNATIEPYIFWRLQPSVKNEEGAIANVNEKVPGLRWVGKLPLAIDYGIEMDREFGSVGADRIRAWAGHWVVGKALPSVWSKPRLFVEFNHASGDANPKDGIRGTFDQLYPTNHDKYGLADQIGWRNINDLRAGIEARPLKKTGFNVEFNDWRLASRFDSLYNVAGVPVFRSAAGTAGTHVGAEIDFIATYAMFKPLQAGAGFGHIFPGEFLKNVTPGASYDFPYLMFTYKF